MHEEVIRQKLNYSREWDCDYTGVAFFPCHSATVSGRVVQLALNCRKDENSKNETSTSLKTGVLKKVKQISTGRAREVYNLAAGAALKQIHVKCRNILHVKVERAKKQMCRKEGCFLQREIQPSV